MKKVEAILEKIILFSRWIQMPIYFGLILAGLIYLYKFFSELFNLIWNIFNLSSNQILIGILTLIDISLVSNLLIMVIIGGYSSFVSKIDFKNNDDKPDWIDKIDDFTIKLKLFMSIVIIAAIDLLRSFIDIDHIDHENLKLQLLIFGILLTTVIIFAVTKKLYYSKEN